MKRSLVWMACILTLVMALPAGADWLVTHDGARVETKGPWKVKGSQVIFTLPNGTLSVLRKSEVDLDASAVATAQSQKPEATETVEEKPQASVLVLTNKDIRRAGEAQEESIEGGDGEAAEAESDAPAAAAAPSRRGVELVSWTSRDSASVDGLEIVGSVKNTGGNIAANITVKVTVLDQDGSPLLDTSAFLRSTGLAPGKSTTFRALLPGVFSLFQDPKFDISSGSVSIGGPAQDSDDEDDETETDEVFEEAGG